MNQTIVFTALFYFLFFQVKAQTSLEHGDANSQDFVTSFRPSLALVMGVLSIMFSLTFLLIVYAKYCRSAASTIHTDQNLRQRSMSTLSGLDKSVVESLPFFRFSSLRGSKEGLECAVCLSKFEDIEILRLLPKCRHAFHIGCVDQWLERHSTCPLCRQKVSTEDIAVLTGSSSLRYLWNPSERKEESDLELFVEREEDHRYGSSRFSIGNSFRKSKKCREEEELPIQEECRESKNSEKDLFHKFNHKIVVSDVIYKNRWSNVSSSDLMFLNSEMISAASSNRFASLDATDGQYATRVGIGDDGQVMKIKGEMEKKRLFENKIKGISLADSASSSCLPHGMSDSQANSSLLMENSIAVEKRSKSEITTLSRSKEKGSLRRPSILNDQIKEERMSLWMPIARRTIQWFASKERWSQRYHYNTRQSLDV